MKNQSIADCWQEHGQALDCVNDDQARKHFYSGACYILLLLKSTKGLSEEQIVEILSDLEQEAEIFCWEMVRFEERREAERN